MKYLITILLLLAAAAYSADTLSDIPCPFGLTWGKPLPKSVVCSEIDTANGLKFCTTKAVPKPVKRFDLYIIVSTPKGVSKVIAMGETIEDDQYGTDITNAYSDLIELLREKYGDPSNTFYWYGSHVLYTEPRHFWECMREEGCSRYVTAWRDGQIFLEIKYLGEYGKQGYLNLAYESPAHTDYLNKFREKQRESDKDNL